MSDDKEPTRQSAYDEGADPIDSKQSLTAWQARPKQQSGLEKKHEGWVLETLNFLQALDIPFYTRKPNGDRDPKRDKEIPERLALAREMILTAQADALRTRAAMVRAQDRAEKLELELVAIKATLLEAFDMVDVDDGETWPAGALNLLGSVEALVGKKEEESDDSSNPQPV